MVGFTLFLLTLLLAPFIVRLAPMGPRSFPRRKPGESPEEVRVILLGTYRVYTYLAVIAAAPTAYRLATGESLIDPGSWYRWVDLVLLAIRVVLAWSLYWRLGYGGRRWLFVLGQVSGLFCLAEAFWPLRLDVQAYLQREAQEPAA
ncbi:MAG TPA: hypothetical protein VNT75_23220 [Symbiobacteriaceae bacterium]|nr:hypothetical protein [Symbiobacteriaceae bacterium]